MLDDEKMAASERNASEYEDTDTKKKQFYDTIIDKVRSILRASNKTL